MTIDLAVIPTESVHPYRNRRIAATSLPNDHRPLNLVLYIPESHKRTVVEAFIYGRYLQEHRARVSHFLPYLISLETTSRQVVAAAGFRPGSSGKLFLERYLAGPIEQVLAGKLGVSVSRDALVEVGNLAADGTHSSRLMIMAMTAFFHQHGFTRVAMTGTRELANILRRMQLEPMELVNADADKLGEEKNDWGSYYEHQPRVMTGSITASHEKMMMTVNYRHFIRSLRMVNCLSAPGLENPAA